MFLLSRDSILYGVSIPLPLHRLLQYFTCSHWPRLLQRLRLVNGLPHEIQTLVSRGFDGIVHSILKSSMFAATIIYPHQLYQNHPAIAHGRPIFLIEEPLLLTEFPTHKQKLLLHRLSMKAYEQHLLDSGYTVYYIAHTKGSTTKSVLENIITTHHITELHIVDTTDTWLEQRIMQVCTIVHVARIRYESPLFLLSKEDAINRYLKSKKHMARFYKNMRIDFDILVDDQKNPIGGAWSFDTENRKRIPKQHLLPSDITYYENQAIIEARIWLTNIKSEQYGAEQVWLPYTHEDAATWLADFIRERFDQFGPYEDAIVQDQTRLYHSTLSPLLNIGLLSPQQILRAVLDTGTTNNIPLTSLEGFIRQIIGWREFIRASYETDGTAMRTKNFWNHTNALPSGAWNATTGITPLDDTITKALNYGYTHHIERLMVAGNFLLLSGTHPDAVYTWFMGLFVDAYDWVMVPNVYGMSQFADGGIFATKPYISGSNYLHKMSNYPKAPWAATWDGLYWNFIKTHDAFFKSQHRLSMMPRLFEKMDEQTKTKHLTHAATYLKTLTPYTKK